MSRFGFGLTASWRPPVSGFDMSVGTHGVLALNVMKQWIITIETVHVKFFCFHQTIYRKEIYRPKQTPIPCSVRHTYAHDNLAQLKFPHHASFYVKPNPTPSPFIPLSLTSLLSRPPLPISLILRPSIRPLSPLFCNPTTALTTPFQTSRSSMPLP